MPRGRPAKIGDRCTNRNGYECVKTPDGWKGIHIVLMEEYLERPLLPTEFVAYKDGHKPPVTLDMIELRTRGDGKSKAARIAAIDARISELEAERAFLDEDE